MLFEIQVGEELKKIEMNPGDRIHVTPPTVHRMTAIEDCEIMEVSTPELDDVVRLEDRYGLHRHVESLGFEQDCSSLDRARRFRLTRPRAQPRLSPIRHIISIPAVARPIYFL